MDILTYVLIVVFILLMLGCFKGMAKGGGCCGMTRGGKDSCQTNKKDSNVSSETSSSQSENLKKMNAQMEEVEKQNKQLMKEIKELKSQRN